MIESVDVVRIAGALLLTTVVPGCATSPPASPDAIGTTATVSINSHTTGHRYPVRCAKVRWLMTIETYTATPGFTAIVNTEDGVDAKVVKIRDLGGFTGTAWAGGVGHVNATRDDKQITISGSGYGFSADDTRRPATVPFSITAAC